MGKFPATFFMKGFTMKELSIFIDGSGFEYKLDGVSSFLLQSLGFSPFFSDLRGLTRRAASTREAGAAVGPLPGPQGLRPVAVYGRSPYAPPIP